MNVFVQTDCPEDCIFDNYHVSSSSTQLDLGDHDDMHSNEKHDDRVVHTAIHFYYSSFSFTVIKNHPGSLVKWLSKFHFSFVLNVSLRLYKVKFTSMKVM